MAQIAQYFCVTVGAIFLVRGIVKPILANLAAWRRFRLAHIHLASVRGMQKARALVEAGFLMRLRSYGI
jgi:hypothetical protein